VALAHTLSDETVELLDGVDAKLSSPPHSWFAVRWIPSVESITARSHRNRRTGMCLQLVLVYLRTVLRGQPLDLVAVSDLVALHGLQVIDGEDDDTSDRQ
jgi:hypothetical protein